MSTRLKKEKKISYIVMMLILVIVGVTLCGCTSKEPISDNDVVVDSNISDVDGQEENIVTYSPEQVLAIEYPDVFGHDGTHVYPPQSVILNNIISINPNKDKRFFLVNLNSSIDLLDTKQTIYYYVDVDNMVEISLRYHDTKKLIVDENIDGTDIYIYKTADSSDLKRTRYVFLDGIQDNWLGQKYGMSFSPEAKVTNEEILKIAKNFVVDTTRGELVSEGFKNKFIANEEDLKFQVGNYELDFKNVEIRDWYIAGDNSNRISYFIEKNGEYEEFLVRFPYDSTKSMGDVKTQIEGLKARIEFANEGLADLNMQTELIEMEVEGIKFYAEKIKLLDENEEYFGAIYIVLDDNNTASFSEFKAKDEADVKLLFEEKILEVLHKN